jgi:inner membrane protein
VRTLDPDVVDNLCHSLVGAALSGAGFRRRTGLATVTMVIGANLPDVDVLVYLFGGGGASALAFRRGWTHGVLAMVVLPLLLAGLMTWVGRKRQARRERRGRPTLGPPISFSQLLVVSAISIWSHPLFDLLNTYGVRLLMPFSPRWFYGDTLFIVDPWVWIALGIGTFMSIRRARAVPVGAGSKAVMARAERPARLAIAAVITYISAMAVSAWLGRNIVERQAVASGSPQALRVMVAPNPLTPYTRSVIRDMGLWYETGTLSLARDARYAANGPPIVKASNAAIIAAMASPSGRQFMSWSRFPFAEVTTDSVVTVRLDDARYASPGSRSFASTSIIVSRRDSAAADSAHADRSKSQ